MTTEIFVTSWTERQRFENELMTFADKEIKEFNGTNLMSWYSNKKEPILDNDFVNSLSNDNRQRLQVLIKSLR
jgi:hypothetical protein